MKKSFLHIFYFFLFIVILFFILKIPVKKRLNVIIISVDHLGAKKLFAYGYLLDTTPHLNKFFNESYLFMNAISPSSWTPPSAMSLFTSLYPHQHKITHLFADPYAETPENVFINLWEVNPSIVTLAEILKKNGYKTAAFTGSGGIQPEVGFDHGFDYFLKNPFPIGKKLSHNVFEFSLPPALKWLEKNKNRDFFLFLQGFDLYGKNPPKQGYNYRYVKKPYTGSYTGSGGEFSKFIRNNTETYPINISEEDILFWQAIYDEKINNVDKTLQSFFKKINDLNLDKNTIIIFASNHGQEFFEHNSVSDGQSLYQELIHVPLAIRMPGQTKGKKIESLISTIDIAPTILNLLGLKNQFPHKIQGVDLTPAFQGKDVSHTVYSETEKFRNANAYAVITPEKYKFIFKKNVLNNNISKELYYLWDDPEEKNNLAQPLYKKSYELEQMLLDALKK